MTIIDVECQICKKIFQVTEWKIKHKRKFCSLQCTGIAKRVEKNCTDCGKRISTKHLKIKSCLQCYGKRRRGKPIPHLINQTPWNKGLKGFMTDESHPHWKGENASYAAIHHWIKRKKGKPKKCVNCGSIKNVQWANKSGQYKRNLNDFIEKCAKCHWHHDHKDGKRTTKNEHKYAKATRRKYRKKKNNH